MTSETRGLKKPEGLQGFTASECLQGGEYEFRVKAVNAAGPSRPSATAGPLVIKDQTCE